jgi:hypothetical protein
VRSPALTRPGELCRTCSPRPAPRSAGYLLGQQGQRVPRLRGRRGGRLQKVVLGVGAGHGTVRVTAVWLPPRDYHHPSGSGRWARLREGGRAGGGRRPRALEPSGAGHDAAGRARVAGSQRADSGGRWLDHLATGASGLTRPPPAIGRALPSSALIGMRFAQS